MRKKRNKGRKSSVKPAARVKTTKPVGDQRTAMRMLVVCVVVLIVGLALRFFWSNQEQSTIRTLRAQAIEAEKDANWAKLESVAREWATLQPDEYEPWSYASAAAVQLGDMELAIEYLERMPDASPVEAFHQLGLMQMEQAVRPQASYATCLRTLKNYPKDAETHTRLLYYYTMTCQRDRIRSEVRRVIGLGCETSVSYVYLFASSWLTFTNGYNTNRLWLESDPDNELFEAAAVIHLYSRQMDDEGNRKETAEDLQEYENALFRQREENPGSVELLAAELELRCENGDLGIVQELLALAPEQTSDDHRFLRFWGWQESALGNWQAAQKYYEKGLKFQPYDWEIQTELELVLRRLNEAEEATKMRVLAEQGRRIARAIQVSPSLFDVPAETLEDLADYYSACGMKTESQRLESLIP